MVALARNSTGLLYRSDGSLTGWSGAAEWTSAADPQFVCWPLAQSLLTRDVNGSDQAGVREAQVFREGASWWMVYDGGNGVTGWRQFFAQSLDKGVTWRRLGAASMGLNKVSSGTWSAVATGWLEKRGSTYYLHRVVAPSTFSAPDIGLPAGPYKWDCWTATSLPGTWAAAPNCPTGNQYYDHNGNAEFLPGSVVLNGGVYYGFAQAQISGQYRVGVCASAANPDGPFVSFTTAFVDSSTTGLAARYPENPRVFYSSTLGRWVCLVNLIIPVGTSTDANGAGYSTSLTDWSSAIWRLLQHKTAPMDTANNRIVGVACHMTGPDGALIEGPNGEVPITYDADALMTSPGWHSDRAIRQAVLEPSTAALHIAQSANLTDYAIKRTLSHTDIVVESAISVTAINGSSFRVRIEYRRDSTGANGYRCVMGPSGLLLEKVVSGSASTLASSGGSVVYNLHMLNRIKIRVVGNVHTLWLDGEQQVSYTDNSSPITSGGFLGVSSKGITGDIRNITVRTSDALTVNGLQPGTSIWLRAYGDLPVQTAIANDSGVATVIADHWPHYGLDPDGTSYTASDALWGGDDVTFTGITKKVYRTRTKRRF